MKINITKKQIEKIKNLGKKIIITGSIIGTLSSPIMKVEAEAKSATIDTSTGYHELSDDGKYLYLDGCDNISFINDMAVEEVYIKNSKINTNIDNDNIESITFDECKFNNNISQWGDINQITFIACYPDSLKEVTESKVENLSFKNCNLYDLKTISPNNCITELSLTKCNIVKLNGIENCKKAKTLSFDNVNLEDISLLSSLTNLKSLTLSNTSITSINNIKNLNLTYLDVSNCSKLKTLEPVLEMNNLNILYALNDDMALSDAVLNFSKTITSDIKEEDLEQQKKVKQIANDILTPNMSTNQKIETIVKYVVTSMEYDYRSEQDIEISKEYNNEALGHALNQKGNCKSYTALTSALLNCAGIDTYEVQNDEHIWNLVKVEGDYYWIDSTFIDTGYEAVATSSNFMTQDQSFLDNHKNAYYPQSYFEQNYKKTNMNYDEKIINNNSNSDNTNNIKNNENNNIQDKNINNENKINKIKEKDSTNEIIQNNNNDDEKQNEKLNIGTIIAASGIGISAATGIAVALGYAIKAKQKKEELNYSNEKSSKI